MAEAAAAEVVALVTDRVGYSKHPASAKAAQ